MNQTVTVTSYIDKNNIIFGKEYFVEKDLENDILNGIIIVVNETKKEATKKYSIDYYHLIAKIPNFEFGDCLEQKSLFKEVTESVGDFSEQKVKFNLESLIGRMFTDDYVKETSKLVLKPFDLLYQKKLLCEAFYQNCINYAINIKKEDRWILNDSVIQALKSESDVVKPYEISGFYKKTDFPACAPMEAVYSSSEGTLGTLKAAYSTSNEEKEKI